MSEKGLKSLASITSANLILRSVKRLDVQLEDLKKLGLGLQEEATPEQKSRSTAIALTSGDKRGMVELIYRINRLISYLHKDYIKARNVRQKQYHVVQAFNYALGFHFNSWDELIKNSIIKAIGNNALFETKNIINEDILKLLEKKGMSE